MTVTTEAPIKEQTVTDATSEAPALRWRKLSRPSWSMSKEWWACLTVEMRWPRRVSSVTSRSTSVVLPAFLNPATPMTLCMRLPGSPCWGLKETLSQLRFSRRRGNHLTGPNSFAARHPALQLGLALAVSGTLQARSIGELVAWLKANPDQAVFGSPGLGTGAHFAGLEFGRAAGIAMRHVPYRGTPAALPDLVAGRLPVYLASTAELVEQHRSGGVRILATAGAERWAAFPGIPTLKESGVNIEAPGWFAFYLRSDVSGTVAERLEKEIAAAAALPAVQAKIKALGFGATDTASRNLAAVQRAEFEAWAAVVKTNGFKPE